MKNLRKRLRMEGKGWGLPGYSATVYGSPIVDGKYPVLEEFYGSCPVGIIGELPNRGYYLAVPGMTY
jgi:hypothetical protein